MEKSWDEQDFEGAEMMVRGLSDMLEDVEHDIEVFRAEYRYASDPAQQRELLELLEDSERIAADIRIELNGHAGWTQILVAARVKLEDRQQRTLKFEGPPNSDGH